MASERCIVTITVRVRWWLRLYLSGVVMMSWFTGLYPDMAKVRWYVRQGVKVRVR
jgi:hypothetical protein